MTNDEFNSRPSEYSKMPKEVNIHDKEFNEDYGLKRVEEKKEKEKERKDVDVRRLRRRLLSYLTGAAVGVSIITTTAQNSSVKDPVFSEYTFECFHEAYTEIKDDNYIAVLTGDKSHKVGALWSSTPVDLSNDFTLEFDFLISGDINKTGNSNLAGDGLAVSFSRTDEFYPEKQNDGGELGFVGEFGVEIDQFKNPDGEIRGTVDLDEDHIAVIDDKMNHLSGTQSLVLHGYKWYHTTIVYSIMDDEHAKLSAYIGDELLAESVIAHASMYRGYVGISAANGDAKGWALVSAIKINGEIVRINDKNSVEDKVIPELEKTGIIPPNFGGSNSDVSLKDSSYISNDFDKNEDINETSGENAEIDTSIPEKILDDEEPEISEVLVKCSTCNGYGIICEGSALADDPDGCGGAGVVHCKNCNETGKEKNGKVCSWCNGTLEHICPSFEFHKTCNHCGGSGYVKQTEQQ